MSNTYLPLLHRLQSKDLVFLDSSLNMEEYNLHVFIMVTHSVCGALPLVIIVTSDEKEQTLVDALQLYKSSMPDFGFYGASLSGPRVFMTDNCYELRGFKKSLAQSNNSFMHFPGILNIFIVLVCIHYWYPLLNL